MPSPIVLSETLQTAAAMPETVKAALPALTIMLAKEFGFCYGVERAIDLAYAARKVFPSPARIFLLGEIIHNPEVNDQIRGMGIVSISPKPTDDELSRLQLSGDDVVLIPAFGTEVATRRKLEAIGCQMVDTTCGDVMSSPAISVEFATELNEAWRLMQANHLHGLPVVDRSNRVIGVLTLENFLRHVEAHGAQGIGDNIRRLLRATPSDYSDKPEVVGQIMSNHFAKALTATANREISRRPATCSPLTATSENADARRRSSLQRIRSSRRAIHRPPSISRLRAYCAIEPRKARGYTDSQGSRPCLRCLRLDEHAPTNHSPPDRLDRPSHAYLGVGRWLGSTGAGAASRGPRLPGDRRCRPRHDVLGSGNAARGCRAGEDPDPGGRGPHPRERPHLR